MKSVAVAVLLVALLGAASAQTAKPAAAKAVPKFPIFATPNEAIDSTINNATNEAPCLTMFKQALGLANLAESFDNITTKRTVFAPSDAAFAKLNLTEDTIQTIMMEHGAEILGAHIVEGAALDADRVAELAGKDALNGRNFTAADNSTLTVFAPAAGEAAPTTGNTRKLLQVEVSPSPAVGVSPGPVRTAIATALGVSPSPAVAEIPVTDVTASPAVTESPVVAATASPAVADMTTMEVSPSPAVGGALGAIAALPAVAALPGVAALGALGASPSPALPADAGLVDSTALPGVSPAVLDTGAAGALPVGVSPEVGVSPDMAAMPADATMPADAMPVEASPEPEVPCPEGTPSGITVRTANTTAEVVYPNLASGGTIIHVIDTVLLPEKVQTMLDSMVANITASREAGVNETAAAAAAAIPSPAPRSSAAGVAVSVVAALAPAALLAML